MTVVIEEEKARLKALMEKRAELEGNMDEIIARLTARGGAGMTEGLVDKEVDPIFRRSNTSVQTSKTCHVHCRIDTHASSWILYVYSAIGKLWVVSPFSCCKRVNRD